MNQSVTRIDGRRDGEFSVQFSPSERDPTGTSRPRRRELSKEFWRRRPDLNRGWRFCRAIPGRFRAIAATDDLEEITHAQSNTPIVGLRPSWVALVEIGPRRLAAGTFRAQRYVVAPCARSTLAKSVNSCASARASSVFPLLSCAFKSAPCFTSSRIISFRRFVSG
jgi:hypothetical protein